MLSFTIRRLLQAIPILLGVSILVFLMVQMIPGNALDLMLPSDAPKDLIEKMKAEYGFDKPLWQQYLRWLWMLLHGDLGVSIFDSTPVAATLFDALGNTFVLAIPAAVLGFGLGIFFGVTAALNNGKAADKALSMVSITGVSLPHYWFAIVLVVIFSVELNWLPAQGMQFDTLPSTVEGLKSMVLPVITLSLIPMGVVSRVVRAAVLEVMSQEFVNTLNAKGLWSRSVLGHILKNAAPATLAVMGLQFGYLLGGSILVETVFNWPGSGNLLNLAIFRRDIPVMQGTILVLAAFFVLLNLVVDVAQALIDPRIRR
ncbi:ABC transporter permease [Paenirhodobacter enshiensis]|uniref:ABC transporter permease n=1 Tax=Paenirhodobacter enshiensis TaxID=1105367 RepID=A0A086XTH8_9RHOB|nr:ABC transporter permease [Paenirhodobacter enshiensis]KFI25328.1 ABC transporter permease [Paenirhodobacter enshiensis]